MWRAVVEGVSPDNGVGAFTHMAFSPDATQVAIATTRGFVCVLSDATGVKRHWCHSLEIPHLVWSSDGRYIVTCSHDRTCAVWNALTFDRRQEFEVAHKATFCEINDASSRVVVADSYGLIYLFVKGEPAPVFAAAAGPSVMTGLRYAGDGRLLVVTFCDSACKVFDDTFTLLSSYSVDQTETEAELPHFTACAVSDSGRTVFVRATGGRVVSFDPADGRLDEHVYTGFECGPCRGDLHYLGATRELVTQSDDGRIVCWDVPGREVKWQIHIGARVALAVSRDGSDRRG